MLAEALVSDSLADALGRVVAEKQREFEQLIALRDAQYHALQMEIRNDVREQMDKLSRAVLALKDGKDGAMGPAGPAGASGPAGPQGERGEQGQPGVDGADGLDGEQGKEGRPGPFGEKGEAGPAGPQGVAGPPGEAGAAGPPGPAGRDGRDGLPGVPGAQGERGKDGREGTDGKDGAGFDSWAVEYDGQRSVTFTTGHGELIKQHKLTLPIPIFRGKWMDKQYQRGDEVTHGGQVFRALLDTDEKPGQSVY